MVRLAGDNQALLERLAPEATLKPEVAGDLSVVNLLKVALKNEIEATEIAARWLVTTEELPVKLALARQVGDEARHYRLIADRLKALFAATSFDPLAKGYGPLFTYLDTLRSGGAGHRRANFRARDREEPTVHPSSARRLARDGSALPGYLKPDERHHHEWAASGRPWLPPPARDAARAARHTLALAEGASGVRRRWDHHAPGC